MVKLLPLLLLPLFLGCEKMLFYPDHHVYRTPDHENLVYRDIYFNSTDGTRLHGWWIEPAGISKGLMVVVHGNAQNLTSHYGSWVWLVKSGYELFIFDYRGYGKSEGEPELAKAVEDTAAALHYADEHFDGETYVCGQSLGGVLLINVLASGGHDNYRLAIIDSAYSDLEAMGREVLSRSFVTWPFQWVSYLALTDSYNPVDKVAGIQLPLLFIAGSADNIIPANNTWQLFDAASRPREMWLVEGAGHIRAMDRPGIQKALLKYLKTLPVQADYSVLKIYDNADSP